METKFTEQESLSLISEMIEQARNNFQKESGTRMIYNGLLVSIVAILNAILILVLERTNAPYVYFSFWVWFLMIPGHLILRTINSRAMVKTHIDTIIHSTWRSFAYSIYVFLAVLFIMGFGKKVYEVLDLINPAILVLIGLAEYITAKAYRFKPYLYGAIIMWIGALACAAALWIWEPVVIQFFVLATCMIFGFVIPGYRLNKLAKDSQ